MSRSFRHARLEVNERLIAAAESTPEQRWAAVHTLVYRARDQMQARATVQKRKATHLLRYILRLAIQLYMIPPLTGESYLRLGDLYRIEAALPGSNASHGQSEACYKLSRTLGHPLASVQLALVHLRLGNLGVAHFYSKGSTNKRGQAICQRVQGVSTVCDFVFTATAVPWTALVPFLTPRDRRQAQLVCREAWLALRHR